MLWARPSSPAGGGNDGHAGYDGVLMGLPGAPVHLEITQHGSPPVIPQPHPENQLVLSMPDPEAVAAVTSRLVAAGHRSVRAASPPPSRQPA